MVHDIDLANALFEGEAIVKSAFGTSAHTKLIDEASVEIDYAGGGVAKLSASRCAEARKRTMKVVYPSGIVEIDFLAKTVKNETPFEIKLDVSDSMPDPLKAADEGFFAAALGLSQSPIPGEFGAKAASLAHAVEIAINNNA